MKQFWDAVPKEAFADVPLAAPAPFKVAGSSGFDFTDYKSLFIECAVNAFRLALRLQRAQNSRRNLLCALRRKRGLWLRVRVDADALLQALPLYLDERIINGWAVASAQEKGRPALEAIRLFEMRRREEKVADAPQY